LPKAPSLICILGSWEAGASACSPPPLPQRYLSWRGLGQHLLLNLRTTVHPSRATNHTMYEFGGNRF
jgi:hypothetical protein